MHVIGWPKAAHSADNLVLSASIAKELAYTSCNPLKYTPHLVQTRLRKLQGRYTLCCFSGFRPLRYHGAGLMLGSCVPTALTSRAIGAGFACSSTFTLLAMTAGYTAASSSTYATPTHRPH